MNFLFTRLAQQEIQDAVTFYDEISSTLVDDLLDEVKQAERLIKLFPNAWSQIGKYQRKYVLKKFPYLIIYKVYENSILVTAFAHKHRNPERFVDRD